MIYVKERGKSLGCSLKNGHDSTLQLLLENGTIINMLTKNEESPLFAACENGHQNNVQIILNNWRSVNHCRKDGRNSLYAACENRHTSTVQLLLKSGADLNICTKYSKPLGQFKPNLAHNNIHRQRWFNIV